MSRERANIRMDKDIFDFFDNMAEEEGISRSEAMVIALKEYKTKVEEEQILTDTLNRLNKMDREIKTKDSDKIKELLSKLSKGKNTCNKKNSIKVLEEDLSNLNLLLNILPEEDTKEANTLLDGFDNITKEDLNLAKELTDSLDKYNEFLQSLSTPIEIINKNFKYHNESLARLTITAESIIEHMGLRGRFIDPHGLRFIHEGRKFRNFNNRDKRKQEMKEEIKQELKEELLKELKK